MKIDFRVVLENQAHGTYFIILYFIGCILQETELLIICDNLQYPATQ